MSKVVRLRRGETKNIHEFLEHLSDAVDDHGVNQIIVSAKMANGEVLTGYIADDLAERLYLISHLQADIHYELAGVDLDGEH